MIYNDAGLEYVDIGDHERALAWLTEGLALALRTNDPERLVDQLSNLRAQRLEDLGRELDELQVEAKRFLDRAEVDPNDRRHHQKHVTSFSIRQPAPKSVTPSQTVPAVGWFPLDEFPTAVSRWPMLTERWDDDTYEGYCRWLQNALLGFAGGGTRPRLIPIRIEPFIAWCKKEGIDPGKPEAQNQYAADQARYGKSINWPPGRNDPCWCGSGRKYKKCCGNV